MRRQRGVTLIIALIMLVLLTIMAISSLNIGSSSLQITGNAQQSAQVMNAAQGMLEQVISTPTFADSPTNVLDNSNCPVGMSPPSNSRCVDLYGDGKTVVNVAMTPPPACVQARAVLNTELDLTTSDGLGCTLGESQNFGVAGAATGASLCSDAMWEMNAVATEQVSQAQAAITQGVAMRGSSDATATSCP
jgi:Tfp pilus assembly protein PilV